VKSEKGLIIQLHSGALNDQDFITHCLKTVAGLALRPDHSPLNH
jgi:hypothetical protein